MWNIPSGATFWVPITSLFYQQGGGGGGFPELPELIPPTQRTARNTDDIAATGGMSLEALRAILEALREAKPTELPVEEWAPEALALQKEWEDTVGTFPTVPVPEIPEPVEPAWYGKEALEILPLMMEAQEAPEETGEFWSTFMEFLGRFGETGVGWGITPPPTDIPSLGPTTTDVTVDIPKIDVETTIQNNVMLDGRQIASFVNRVVEKAMARMLRAKGKTLLK